MNISGTNIQGGVNLTSTADLITVTGGTVTYDGAFTVRTFTANSNLIISTTNTNRKLLASYVLIGAGGARGSGPGSVYAGGGGGGGFVSQSNVLLDIATYPVTIGQQILNASGGNSVFNNNTAVGGGRGGLSSFQQAGQSGGSGGGGSSPGGLGGAGTAGQGNDGAQAQPTQGGGGGGAGQIGGAGGFGGKGGDGLQSNLSGTNIYYAGGGAGQNGPGVEGQGQTNYGGGGSAFIGGAAQPGVLILRYLTEGTA